MNANEMLIKAKLARSFFTRKTRDDGKTFVCTKDESPEWVSDLCQDAHDDMLPDDFVYNVIEDALDAIIDNDGETEDLHLEADCYNRDLLDWLASSLKRASYCDEACDEYGVEPSEGIMHFISMGQHYEKRQILSNVVESLEKLEIEELDDLE